VIDAEQLQNLEARLSEQAEARATNELITQLFSMMRTRNVDDHITTPTSPSLSLLSLSLPSAKECVALPTDQTGEPRQLQWQQIKGPCLPYLM
jgi:hypothetical protein